MSTLVLYNPVLYTFQNATKGKRERVGRILQMHANHRQEIPEVFSDCGSSWFERHYHQGTLYFKGKGNPQVSSKFPDPVIEVAIEPKVKS